VIKLNVTNVNYHIFYKMANALKLALQISLFYIKIIPKHAKIVILYAMDVKGNHGIVNLVKILKI
jgi:hypothetical protein